MFPPRSLGRQTHRRLSQSTLNQDQSLENKVKPHRPSSPFKVSSQSRDNHKLVSMEDKVRLLNSPNLKEE
jgi:hypothetical protein